MGLKKLITKTAATLGYNLTEQVPPEKIRALLRSLQPQDCGRSLIRIGEAKDGGYLVPDDLEGIRYCFSPGVNVTADFEQHLAKFGIRSFMADASVSGPPQQRPEFIFDQRYIGVIDREPYITLQSWKEKYLRDYDGDMLLQMDIDGTEYEVLLTTPLDLLRRFRIIVLECHDLVRLFEPVAFRLYRACFEKLLEGFVVAHAHPNNCAGKLTQSGLEIPRVMEFTFYNRSRVGALTPRREFPHPLDADNCDGCRPLPLPRCWYE